jgi:hypothetical protein
MIIAIGRCPSQGADSALPVKIMTADEGIHTVRIPAEIC